MFAAMGVDLLVHSLGEIGSAIANFSTKCPPETFTTGMFIITAELIITFTASMILLFWSDGITKIIAGPDADQCEKVDDLWVVTGLRLTACLCGILLLYRPVSLLIAAIINCPDILSYMTLQGQKFQLSTRTTVTTLTATIQGAFAIYLIFGAPHYVRWQMRVIAAKTRGEK
jgi:hypothetical protein